MWAVVVQAEKVFQGEDTKLALEVVVKRDKAAVTEALAQLLVAYATHTVVVKGAFVFAVSGDGPLLALMAELPSLLVGKADWTQVTMVYVNYMCTKPAGHPNTLHQQVLKFATSLGIKVVAPAPEPNPAGDGSAEAAYYKAALQAVGLRKEPLDLVLLDLGLDGKVGGLYPNSPAARSKKYSIVGSKGSPGPLTTTMTLPMLNGSGRCVVVATGAGSAGAVARALNGSDPEGAFPAHSLLSPLYLLDADAASAL